MIAPIRAMTQMPKIASTSPRKWSSVALKLTKSSASAVSRRSAIKRRTFASWSCCTLWDSLVMGMAKKVWMMARTKMIVATSRNGCCLARKASFSPMVSRPMAFSWPANVAISVTKAGSLAWASAAAAPAGTSRKITVNSRVSDFIMRWPKPAQVIGKARTAGKGNRE